MDNRIENTKPTLLVLNNVPDKHLQTEEIASALQSFETSMFLLANHRWPSVLLLLWEACEKFLKAICTSKSDYSEEGRLKWGVSSKKLVQRFKSQSSQAPTELHDRADDLRNFRNDIVHRGYSPRDDRRCIELFFTVGYPYLNALVQRLIGRSIPELSKEREWTGGWFWNIFADTQSLINQRISQNEADLYSACFFLRLATKKVFESTISRAAFNMSETEWVLSEHYQDTHWDIERVIRNRFIEELSSPPQDCVELSEFQCPVYGHPDVLAGATWHKNTNGYKLDSIKAFGCLECNYIVSEQDLVQVFCQEKLTQAEIDSLESEDFPVAEPVY